MALILQLLPFEVNPTSRIPGTMQLATYGQVIEIKTKQ